MAAKKRRAKGASEGRWGTLFRGLTLGSDLEEGTQARIRELTGLSMIGLAAWLLVSLVSHQFGADEASAENLGGAVGTILSSWVFRVFGVSGYLLGVLTLCWGVVLLTHREVSLPVVRALGAVCFLLSASFLIDLGMVPTEEIERANLTEVTEKLKYGPGGWLAFKSNPVLVARFGNLGLWILLLTTAVVSFVLATDWAFHESVVSFTEWVSERRSDRGEGVLRGVGAWAVALALGLWNFLRGADLAPESTAKAKAATKKKSKAAAKPKKKAKPVVEPELEEELEDDEDEYEYEDDEEAEYEEDDEYEYEEDEEAEYEEEEDDEYEEEYAEEEDDEVLAPLPSKKKEKPRFEAKQSAQVAPMFDPPSPPPGPWSYPPLDLLVQPEDSSEESRSFIEKNAAALEAALSSFKVEASVVNAQVGPAVTMYELEVSQGTRLNKVTALTSEIAATLRAKSVRVIAPIPGKATIGIEIPNSNRRKVRISELVNRTKNIYGQDRALPLFLGMDAEGNPIVEDLARMPHLLIAGTTGSGKSVCINTIIASILLTRSPHDAKLILVDPKMVELMMFEKVPHLELPVVTDMRQATNVLNWAVEKMEARYELFSKAGVKNIKTYNNLGEEKLRERLGDDFNEERTPRHVPYIVLVIDEMADLMMQSKKEAEAGIMRLAQKSRAVGIHVIVATQRPSADVITGVIKGNLPTRIAFQVASKIDSRVILDNSGAEALLGQGDMLFSPPMSSQLKRVQGAMIEDDELQSIVDFVTTEAPQTFNQEIVQAATGTAPPGEATQGGEKHDELFFEAGKLIIKNKRGSASLLQRAFSIGYTRASRLVDQMTDAGVLGPHTGSKAREILMTVDEFEETFGVSHD